MSATNVVSLKKESIKREIRSQLESMRQERDKTLARIEAMEQSGPLSKKDRACIREARKSLEFVNWLLPSKRK